MGTFYNDTNVSSELAYLTHIRNSHIWSSAGLVKSWTPHPIPAANSVETHMQEEDKNIYSEVLECTSKHWGLFLFNKLFWWLLGETGLSYAPCGNGAREKSSVHLPLANLISLFHTNEEREPTLSVRMTATVQSQSPANDPSKNLTRSHKFWHLNTLQNKSKSPLQWPWIWGPGASLLVKAVPFLRLQSLLAGYIQKTHWWTQRNCQPIS